MFFASETAVFVTGFCHICLSNDIPLLTTAMCLCTEKTHRIAVWYPYIMHELVDVKGVKTYESKPQNMLCHHPPEVDLVR